MMESWVVEKLKDNPLTEEDVKVIVDKVRENDKAFDEESKNIK